MGFEPANPGSGQPTRDQPNKLWAGKYSSAEELEKGYMNLYDMSMQTYKELQSMKHGGESPPRMDPAQRSDSRRLAAETLQELGVPPDAVASSQAMFDFAALKSLCCRGTKMSRGDRSVSFRR